MSNNYCLKAKGQVPQPQVKPNKCVCICFLKYSKWPAKRTEVVGFCDVQ